MLKKFLVFFKVIFIVVLIGAFIVGFKYQNSKSKEKGQSINIDQKQVLIKTDHSSLNIIKNETLENNKNIEDSPKESQLQNDNKIVLDNNMDKTTIQDETYNNSNENQEQIYNNVDNNKEQQNNNNNNNNNNTDDSNDKTVNISVNVNDDVEYDDPNDYIYPTIEACNQAGIDISLTNTVDIINTFCFSHSENGKFLGYKLYINCESGNCDKYKK